MSKAVLISIQPQWCELLASGKKTLEVRKNMPKLETPFKCYVYCTKTDNPISICTQNSHDYTCGKSFRYSGGGEVIGEFVCDRIQCFDVPYPAFQKELDKRILDESCCTYYQLHRYAYHDALYGWRISDLVVYDKPKELSEFNQCHKCPYSDYENCKQHEYSCNGEYKMKRPPQSWCYVEELKGGAK